MGLITQGVANKGGLKDYYMLFKMGNINISLLLIY